MAKPAKKPTQSRERRLEPIEPGFAQLVETSRHAPNVTIDCGFARETGFGGVELVLLAYRRGGPAGALETVVVIAYEPDEFVGRSKANAEFAALLEQHLQRTGGRGERGALAKEAESRLRKTEEADPSHVGLFPADYYSYEAVSELLYHTNQRGGIVFVGVLPVLRHHAALLKDPTTKEPVKASVPASLVLSASLPSRALADLLDSWKSLADAIEANRPS